MPEPKPDEKIFGEFSVRVPQPEHLVSHSLMAARGMCSPETPCNACIASMKVKENGK